ncbi:MAG: DUF1702 family protein [Mangrovicoccus sp.]
MIRTLAPVALVLTLAAPAVNAAPEGRGALSELLAQAETLAPQRESVLAEAEALIGAGDRNGGLDLVEAYLRSNPGDVIAGNAYRQMAVAGQVHDRPIRFFNEVLLQFDPDLEDEIHPWAPPGLRYNLAFAYIDKIPVVGPMGAGFLSKRSIAQFQIALAEDGEDWIANYGVGMNYLHWPDYFEKNDSSMSYFEKAVELQDADAPLPLDMLSYVRLGDAYAKAGMIDEAFATWEAGKDVFGDYADLEERLEIAPAKIKDAVTEAYNPNNSIGEINTDISILWSETLPDSLFALETGRHFSSYTQGVGGQKAAEGNEDESLFVWFQKNLPFLLKRESAETLDMTYLGENVNDVAGVIAFDMIQGFMTQVLDKPAEEVMAELEGSTPYDRPFLHEGVGMGLAAKLDTGGESLAKFDEEIAPLGEQFKRLQYAGLGMWYGMAPRPNIVAINHALADLPLQGQFYAYEGLGFAATLFGRGPLEQSVGLTRRMPFAAASTFAHGLGRALWIKHGGIAEPTEADLAKLPENLRNEARSGLGMGLAFTRIEHPEDIYERAIAFRGADEASCKAVLTGVAMGYAIRFVGNPNYVKMSFRAAHEDETRTALTMLLAAGLTSLKEITMVYDEMHTNLRSSITARLADERFATLTTSMCGDAS